MKNKIQCQICKKYFKTTSNSHLLRKHNISIAEYRKLFPEASLHSPNCTCYICKTKRGETKGENGPFYGKHHTKESRLKISLNNNSSGMTGKHHSKESREKSSLSHLGYVTPEATKEKQRKNAGTAHHKLDCQCCFCKNKRGNNHITEEHKRKIGLSEQGDKHWNWQGGITFEPYPFEFNFDLKESIRKRDNYECQICGIEEELHILFYGRRLTVHHVTYNKRELDPNKLVTLCQKCHGDTNTDREYWEEYFLKLHFN